MAYKIKNLMDAIEIPKEGILSTPIEDNEYFKSVLFMMPAEQYISPHTSTMASTIYVIQGKADFTLGEETHEIKPGDYFYMPPNYNHAVKAKEDFAFLLTLRK